MFSHDKTNSFSIVRACSQSFAISCAALALFLGTTQANAAVLFFDSFEPGTYGNPGDGNGSDINGANGWTRTGSFATVTNPPAPYYFDGVGGDNQGELPNGFQGVLIQQGTTIAKILGSTVPGTTYTLTGRIGDLRGTSGLITDEPAAEISLFLFVNGSQVASATAFPTANTTTSPTVNYVFDTLTTTPYVAASVLPNLEIRIAATAASGNFTFVDAVQLDAVEAAVPEPSTFVLSALGLAGLGLVAWRRKR